MTSHPTDVRIERTDVEFRLVEFDSPLQLGSGTINGLTEAVVRVAAVSRDGRRAFGLGSVLLSHVWAGGTDELMRTAVTRFAELVVGDEFADALEHGRRLLDAEHGFDLPTLAVDVARGPVDQAVHDAWSRAAGLSAYRMYGPDYLDHDLGRYLGPRFTGHWPSDWLRTSPHETLPVQYVVGLADPRPVEFPYPWMKVKLSGHLDADLARVEEVAVDGVSISLDPNESYELDADVAALRAGTGASYIEQPTSRGRPGPGEGRTPVVADEGLPAPCELETLTGWDGVVVKTARGQTTALLTYCWARGRRRFVVQQDLTNVGAALAHGAAFAAFCDYSVRAFECNSLQYAPRGNTELARSRPELTTPVAGSLLVRAGRVGLR